MAKKTKRAAKSRKSGSSAEYKAVIDDLVMGNRILYDQGVPGIEGNSYQAGELAFQALMQSDHDTRQRMAGELAGRSRPMIEIVQRLLAKVGAYGGPIDGDMGPATREAIGKL